METVVETVVATMDEALIEGMSDQEWTAYWEAKGRILRAEVMARKRINESRRRSDGQLGRKNGKALAATNLGIESMKAGKGQSLESVLKASEAEIAERQRVKAHETEGKAG